MFSALSRKVPTCALALVLGWTLAGAALAQPDRGAARWSVDHHAPVETSLGSPPQQLVVTSDLVLDDGSREADVGFNSTVAFQFLWFNHFDAPSATQYFFLEQIQVLFPPDPGVVPGAAIQLVVFTDPDGDPTNGANLVAAWDDVVQVADGVTFSVYPVAPQVQIPPGSGDVLVGVVNRFVDSGVSPPTRPAALDTSSSAGRSWLATWTSDPPNPPSLPTDDLLELVDVVAPGNWLIRASGHLEAGLPIPALDPVGLAALALLLALAAVVVLRQR